VNCFLFFQIYLDKIHLKNIYRFSEIQKTYNIYLKTKALALIEAVSFYGRVCHKRYKRIAGNSFKTLKFNYFKFEIPIFSLQNLCQTFKL